MPTNQYLAFAYGGGANVEIPATYLADARRTNGNIAGIADPAFCNTAWRQTTVAVAALAQLVCDFTASSMLDDGSIANFEAGLLLVINNIIKTALAAGSAPVLQAKQTPAIVSGVVNIDFSLGNYFVVLMNASITSLTFSNFPPSGKEQEITVDFIGDGTDHGHTFLAEALLKWLGQGAAGTAPTFAYGSGVVNKVVFQARDAVTTRVEAAYAGTAAA